jgi:hypothetical protein
VDNSVDNCNIGRNADIIFTWPINWGALPSVKKVCILCPSGIATLDIERPALLVEESTGLDFETSCKDVSLTDELIIGNSGGLCKRRFDQKG